VAIRTSDGIYLEVIESGPVLGVPVELDVYGGDNVATMLATLEGAQEPGFTDPFGDIGSGHFRIPVTDPKATGAIIRSGNYVKVKIAGVYRYAFWLENPRKIVASVNGAAGEYWDLGGRGNISYLERASVYPPGWPTSTGTTHEYVAVTAASILVELLTAAKARGAIPQLTWDFTASRDSDNAPWTDSITMSVPAGMSLLDLWRQLVGMGYESEMTPDLKLRFFRDRSRDFSQTVIFRAGKHIRGEVTRDPQDAGLRTRMLVEGDGGRFFEVTDPVLEADPFIGRREGYLSFTASTDPTTLQQVGDNALEEVGLASEALSVPLHHGIGNGDFEPYADYRNGDWVGLDIPGTYTLERVRVRLITIEAVASDYTVEVDFNSVSLEALVRLKRIVDALSGGGSASLVVGATGGGLSGSGGASAGNSGRLSAEQGDTPGYLYDKIAAGAGIAKAMIGSVADRQVELSAALALDDLADVDTAGVTDGQALVRDAASGTWKPGTGGSGAPTTADYLVGTAQAGLSAEIVVGPTPGGELGGTWASPTVDATHSGSTHAAAQAAAESTAAGALSSHEGAADPHTGYQKESEKGAASGYAGLGAGGLVPIAQLASGSPDGTKFIRDDGTLVAPAGGGGVAGVTFPIVAVFDGGASAITGNPEVDVTLPADGTITGWTLLADASGDAVVDIWKDVYANYPPTVVDTITAAALPTLSGAVKATNSTLTGWTTALAAGDVLRFHLNSSATVKRLELTLTYTRS